MRKLASSIFIKWSVRSQLLFLAILLTLPSLGIIIYSGLKDRREAFNNTAIESQKLADNIAAEQQNLIAAAHQLGSVLAELPDVKSGRSARVQPILANILKLNPQFQSIIVVDRHGNTLASAIPANKPVSVADRRYFRNAAATHRFSSGEYAIGRHSGRPTITMGYPLVDEHGEFYGVIALSFDLGRFEGLLKRSQLPPDTNYIITDHKGTIITRGYDPVGYIGTQIRPELLEQMRTGPEKLTHVFIRNDGDERISTYRRLTLSGENTPYLYIRAGMSLKATMAQANRDLLSNLSILFAFVLMSFALAVIVGKRSIADRLVRLQQAAKRIAEGDCRSRISDSVTGGELGELGLAFDDMANTLDMRITELKRVQEELVVKQLQLQNLNHTLEERIVTAITDLRHKDQILINQGRLAAMGEMINNIAHQWRQPLNNIGLIVQDLEMSYESGELTEKEMHEEVNKVMNTITFMSSTIDDFRNFFRKDKQLNNFSINRAVDSALQFIGASLHSSDIKVDLTAEHDVTIIGYRNEYAQVLLNILSNARDLLVARKVREPSIRICLNKYEGLSLLTISDNAGGIPPEILPRIFDPYFTTNETGKGTGIGLYMSKVIIEQNMKGRLTACNIEGGAEFRIEV